MKTIAIIGVGPGLGLFIARQLGKQGFRVALIARTQTNLDRGGVKVAVTSRKVEAEERREHSADFYFGK